MKPITPFSNLFPAVLFALALAGCATAQDAGHSQHHPQASTSQAPGPMGPGPMGPGAMGSGSSGNQMGMMDMKSMCAMHQQMMSAKTPEEQRAIMDEHMRGMSPEMMQKHMEMMQQHCK